MNFVHTSSLGHPNKMFRLPLPSIRESGLVRQAKKNNNNKRMRQKKRERKTKSLAKIGWPHSHLLPGWSHWKCKICGILVKAIAVTKAAIEQASIHVTKEAVI